MGKLYDVFGNPLGFAGIVTLEHFRKGKLIYTETGKNIFTTQGRAAILNAYFKAEGAPADIYVGIFKSDAAVAAGDTAAAKLGTTGDYGECQDADYTPATNRPAYTIATTTTAVCTNAASKAEFTIVNSTPFTVYGAFLCTVAAKTSDSGVLVCAKRFASSRAVEENDVLAVTYQITTTSS